MKTYLLLVAFLPWHFSGFAQCVITSHPVASSPPGWIGIGDASSLSVTAIATGTNLTYQGFSNPNISNSGGIITPGQSDDTIYTTPVSGPGMVYYYVVLTGDYGSTTNNADPVTLLVTHGNPHVNAGQTINIMAVSIHSSSCIWFGDSFRKQDNVQIISNC
jgi:hypothetical protein